MKIKIAIRFALFFFAVLMLFDNMAYAQEKCKNIQNDTFLHKKMFDFMVKAKQTDKKYSTTDRGSLLYDVFFYQNLRMMSLMNNYIDMLDDGDAISVHVHNDKFAVKGYFSIGMPADELMCLLGKSVGVSLSDGSFNHISLIWAVDRIKREIKFLEVSPLDSPLLHGKNSANIRGTLVSEKNNIKTISVPWDDVKKIITSAVLYTNKNNIKFLVPKSISEKDRYERILKIRAISSYQSSKDWPYEFIKDKIGSEFSSDEIFRSISMFSFAINVVEHGINDNDWGHEYGPINMASVIRKDVVKYWPPIDSLLLARASIIPRYLSASREIIDLIIDDLPEEYTFLANLTIIMIEYMRGDMDSALNGAEGLRESAYEWLGNHNPSKIGPSGNIEQIKGNISSYPNKMIASVIRDCSIIIAQIKMARKEKIDAISDILDIGLNVENDYWAVYLATIILTDVGNLDLASSFYKALIHIRKKGDFHQEINSLFSTEIELHSGFDNEFGFPILLYFMSREIGFLESRIIWKCDAPDKEYLEWMARRNFDKTKDKCLALVK